MSYWQNELVLIVRNLIGDIGCETFTDDRLEEVILVSAQFVISEVTFDTTYSVDVDSASLTPDPTSPRNDMFISLVTLKAACILYRGLLRTYASTEGIKVKDGMGEIQVQGGTGGRFAAFKSMADSFCEAYQKAKLELTMGNFAGVKAIFNVASGPNINSWYSNREDIWR